jgi:hypothetical protein
MFIAKAQRVLASFTGLSGILSSYTKLEGKLEAFLENNAKKIEEQRQELEIAEREQAKAGKVLDRVQAFLND